MSTRHTPFSTTLHLNVEHFHERLVSSAVEFSRQRLVINLTSVSDQQHGAQLSTYLIAFGVEVQQDQLLLALVAGIQVVEEVLVRQHECGLIGGS